MNLVNQIRPLPSPVLSLCCLVGAGFSLWVTNWILCQIFGRDYEVSENTKSLAVLRGCRVGLKLTALGHGYHSCSIRDASSLRLPVPIKPHPAKALSNQVIPKSRLQRDNRIRIRSTTLMILSKNQENPAERLYSRRYSWPPET